MALILSFAQYVVLDMHVHVRQYEATDDHELIALWSNVFPKDPPRNDPSKIIQRKELRQSELLFVAVRDDSIIGAVVGGYDGYRGWIYHLAVHPDHRRQGVARLLVRTAEAKLAELGCPKVNLQIRSDNQSVQTFYEGLGYSTEERISMGKPLTGE